MAGQRRALLALSTVTVVLGTAAPALAATVRLDVRSVGPEKVAQLVYRGAPAERNLPSISDTLPVPAPPEQDANAPGTDYWLRGQLRSTTAGRGCTRATVLEFDGRPRRLIRCPVPAGARPGGAAVYLGDHNDRARMALTRSRALVVGGPGHDRISAEGRLDGGAGNDHLFGAGRLNGGPGHDDVEGSGRLDGGRGFDRLLGSGRLVGGPGRDEIRGSAKRDVIDARDRSVDSVSCEAGRDTALLDALDTYLLDRRGSYWDWKDPSPRECEQLHRRGVARAAPIFVWGDATDPAFGYNWGVDVGCPPDGPAVCVGDVTVWRGGRRVIGRDDFRITRGTADYGGYWANATQQFLSRMSGKRVWVRVRSLDRHGHVQTASAPFSFLVDTLAYD
jgi:hypothetical protein